MEANGGSGRKSAMTRVGWLHGLLPAKREKVEGEIASLTHSAYIFYFFYFILFLYAKDLKMHSRMCPLFMRNNSVVFI